jgi:hypothetical protein
MKRQQSLPPQVQPGNRIKLRLNQRTIIVVRTQEALQMWMQKFPTAQIIS